MSLMNLELLKSNCLNDQPMMREIISMGLQSVSGSMPDIKNFLESKDWDKLARVLHKLRPILCYCGINSLTDDLLLIEQHAKERKDLPELTVRITAIMDTLQQVRTELEQQLSSLSS